MGHNKETCTYQKDTGEILRTDSILHSSVVLIKKVIVKIRG